MSTEWTPITDQVRADYVAHSCLSEQHEVDRTGEFDRWLAAHDQAIWFQGHQAGWEDRHEDWLSGFIPSGYTQDTPNPYRQQVSELADCGCDLTGMTPPAVHIVDNHDGARADEMEKERKHDRHRTLGGSP